VNVTLSAYVRAQMRELMTGNFGSYVGSQALLFLAKAESYLLLILIHPFILADILQMSRFYTLAGGEVQPYILGFIWMLVIIFAFFSILAMRIIPVLVLGFSLFYFLFEAYNFSQISNSPVGLNSVFSFYTLPTFIIFMRYLEIHGGRRLHKILFCYFLMYVLIYCILATSLLLSIVPADLLSPINLATPSDERGDRLFLWKPYALYVLFTAIYQLYKSRAFVPVCLAVICAVAILLSQSRFFILSSAIAAGIASLGFKTRTIAFVCWSCLLFANVLYCFMVIEQSINPYSLFSDDPSGIVDGSGFVRMVSFDVARENILARPLFGTGIESTQKALVDVVGYSLFYWSDLGPIGIWFAFGLIGLFASVILTCIACFVPVDDPHLSKQNYVEVLRLTACPMALAGLIAPDLLFSSIPLSIALAYFCLQARR
jgi:hypothetical protein